MSYMIEAWEKDGPNGEVRLACKVMKRVSETSDIVNSFRTISNCVHITKTRTDGQDTKDPKGMRKVVTIWSKVGYQPL